MSDITRKEYPVNLSYHERLDEINRLLAELDKYPTKAVMEGQIELQEKIDNLTVELNKYRKALKFYAGKLDEDGAFELQHYLHHPIMEAISWGSIMNRADEDFDPENCHLSDVIHHARKLVSCALLEYGKIAREALTSEE